MKLCKQSCKRAKFITIKRRYTEWNKANKSYFEKNQINAENPNILFEAKEIDYIPVDYQQYDTYGIKYIFNTDLNSFDAKMLNNE